MHLKVNVVRAPGVPLNTYRPQISLQDLRRYGFNEMLLNVVEAPEPVLCYFCQRQGLHHIPIAGKLRPDEVDRITTELKDMKSFFTQEMRVSNSLLIDVQVSFRSTLSSVFCQEESLP